MNSGFRSHLILLCTARPCGFSSSSGARVTTWNYNAYRGWLDNKRYHDNYGTDYTYTDGGKLATRAWARGITTTYAYNNAGDLASVTYDDGATPTITHDYDRRGRRASTSVQSGTTTTFSYIKGSNYNYSTDKGWIR